MLSSQHKIHTSHHTFLWNIIYLTIFQQIPDVHSVLMTLLFCCWHEKMNKESFFFFFFAQQDFLWERCHRFPSSNWVQITQRTNNCCFQNTLSSSLLLLLWQMILLWCLMCQSYRVFLCVFKMKDRWKGWLIDLLFLRYCVRSYRGSSVNEVNKYHNKSAQSSLHMCD